MTSTHKAIAADDKSVCWYCTLTQNKTKLDRPTSIICSTCVRPSLQLTGKMCLVYLHIDECFDIHHDRLRHHHKSGQKPIPCGKYIDEFKSEVLNHPCSYVNCGFLPNRHTIRPVQEIVEEKK